MTADMPVSIQELKQRLAEADTDAGRLAALLEFWTRASELPRDEVMEYLREAAELARKTRSYTELATAGTALSELCRDAGDVRASIEWAGIVREAAGASGSPNHEAQYLYLMGRAHEVQGEYKPARDYYERALEAWRKAGNWKGVAAAMNQLGCVFEFQGQAGEALECFQESLKMDEELGEMAAALNSQYNVGTSLAKLGRWEEAFQCYYRTIALAERHRLPSPSAYVLDSIGELLLERDEAAKAISIFGLVMEAVERGEVPPDAAPEMMAHLGLAYRRIGDFASAEHCYNQALAVAEKYESRHRLAVVLWRMAELALDQGRLDCCRELAERSVAAARDVGAQGEEAQALRVLALVHAACGEDAQARSCFEKALALLGDLEESLDLARVRFHYGRYLLTQGERETAMTHLKAAARVFRKLGVVAEGREADRLLFREELGVDVDTALLQGISRLATLGVGPRAMLERALGLLLTALKFDSAAVIAKGRPVLVLGSPKLETALKLSESQGLVATDLTLSWPVRCGGNRLGRIHLERAAPVATEHDPLVLDAVANLLASPIQRLVELEARVGEKRSELVGLRFDGVVGRNERMLAVLNTVCTVASKTEPVLIRGEDGTGKELVARALHYSGARAGKPFVVVNCAVAPENLLDAECFGIEERSATGVTVRKGKLELTDGGTVFLDEIGDISPALQAKLLRVLQEGTLVRVGGSTPIKVVVRIVAATTQPLDERVAQGRFRADLYHRLNTVELLLPSLNERPEDIPDLVRHLVRRSSNVFGRNVTDVSPEVMARLATHRWSGSVRELENVIDRSVALAHGSTVQLDDLPFDLQSSAGSVDTDIRQRLAVSRHRFR